MVSHSCCLAHLPIAKWFSPVSPQPANCLEMVSCCPHPSCGSGAACRMFSPLLKGLISEMCQSSASIRRRGRLPLCPYTVCTGGCAGTAPLPSWFPGWVADCDAIFLAVSLCSWLLPVIISSPLQACHCHRRVRWDQKGARNAVSFLPQNRMVGINSNWKKYIFFKDFFQ